MTVFSARRLCGAMLVLLVSGAGARADLSLFGAYFGNVARAASHNDAAAVRQLVGSGESPNAIDVLVCKASGGAATEAKLIAARELSLPVIMVRRPPTEPGPAVETVEAALDWLADVDNVMQASAMT